MADFTQADNAIPLMGSVVMRLNKDLGSDPLLALTGQGAGTVTGTTQINAMGRGVRATINISGKTGTISAVFDIEAYDPASGTWTALLTSAALTGNGTTVLTVHPDLPASANLIAQNLVGEQFRVKLVSGTGSSPSFNCTVGICLLA
jgi:hypothetical protein